MEIIRPSVAAERARIMDMLHDTLCVSPCFVPAIARATAVSIAGAMDFIYLSGQITGAEKDYIQEFYDAELSLMETGMNIINPSRIMLQSDHYELYMAIDTSILCAMASMKRKHKSRCRIHMLKSYSKSKGAKAELALATSLKLDVTYV